MLKNILFFSFLLCFFNFFGQSVVVDWSTIGSNATGVVNTSNTPNAVVNISTTSSYNLSCPKYNTGGSANWGMNGLGLCVDWANTSSFVDVTIVFTNPVCSDLSFDIWDLDGNTGLPFEDKVIVSGYDGSNVLIPVVAANYVWSNCLAGTPCGAGNALFDNGSANGRIGRCVNFGGSGNSYGSSSNKITFTLKNPTAPKKIKRVVIRYASSCSTCNTNGYMSSSNPGQQNIVISNITALLPPVISTSFACITTSTSVNLVATASSTSIPTYLWTTSTGTINSGSNTLTANVKSPATYTFTAYNGAVANGCSTQTVITLSSINCSLLPIELISFTAKRINEKVKLEWQTLSEKNNDYFIIEHSLNGINYEEIKRVKGEGNSSKLINYEALDETPDDQISYYRLKQVDYNGQYNYSDIVSIDADNSKASISQIAPNPTSASISFNFYTPIKGELYYEITDLTGRVLVTVIEIMEIGNSKVNTLLNELPNGIYFLKINFDKTNLVSVNKIFKN